MSKVTITLELDDAAAAGLKRFAEKVAFDDARAVLYSHISATLRSEQAYAIMSAFSALDKALAEAKVSSWPWVGTGRA